MKMTDMMLHLLRNPYGYPTTVLRQARIGAADRIEALAGDLEISHKRNTDIINRRVKVEQILLDAANGKRPLPTREECRAMAEHLGVPSEFHNLSKNL